MEDSKTTKTMTRKTTTSRSTKSIALAMTIFTVTTTAQGARTLQAPRLKAPCAVTDTYYPFKTCKVSQDDAECGLGNNSFATMAECCSASFGKEGCTDASSSARCWVPGQYYPQTACKLSTDPEECKVAWGNWQTWAECCASDGSGAFPDGCSAPEPCFVPTEWHPTKACGFTTDESVCLRGWGTFKTEEDCCKPGNGFDTGCTASA